MDIEFDPNKRELTLQARGLDFADAGALFAGPTVTREDTRQDYGEVRWITMGLLDNRSVVVVWTARGTARRIISMRYAHDDEAKKFGLPLG
jgi:uncharacterized protein